MVRIHFCSNNKPGSLIIKALTAGKYSHCAIQIDNEIYESHLRTGVHKPSSLKNVVKSIEVKGLAENDMRAFLEAQVGKPYDKKAIVSFLFKRNWQDLQKWFCSELVAMALLVGEHKGFPKDIPKISPVDLEYYLTKKPANNNFETYQSVYKSPITVWI